MKTLAVIALSTFLISYSAFGEGNRERKRNERSRGNNNNACASQTQAKKQAYDALMRCVNEWNRERRATDPVPTDNCTTGLGNFTTAVQTLLTCVQQPASPTPAPGN